MKINQPTTIPIFKISVLLLIVSFGMVSSLAQSIKREDDILFKQYLVRNIDLKEHANTKIFGSQNILVSTLINAYCSGNLQGYKDDTFSNPISYEEFETLWQLVNGGIYADIKTLTHIELSEYLIFDNRRSEHYFDLSGITINIPASVNVRGLEEKLICFKFNDCEKIFKNTPVAVSINPLKNGRNINYADVFRIRLFNSVIVKTFENGLYVDQIYNDKMQAFVATKNFENNLSEFIYKLYNPE